MAMASGAKSYIVQYRISGTSSPTRRVTIGRHGAPWAPDQARERAADLLEQVRKKIDPFDAARARVEAMLQPSRRTPWASMSLAVLGVLTLGVSIAGSGIQLHHLVEFIGHICRV